MTTPVVCAHESMANFMLRDKSLIPLSHQHQRALALCVRIDRAQPIPTPISGLAG